MDNTGKKFVTIKEFRENYFHISDNKLRELVHQADAPVLKIGRKIMIPVDKFLLWLENKAIGT